MAVIKQFVYVLSYGHDYESQVIASAYQTAEEAILHAEFRRAGLAAKHEPQPDFYEVAMVAIGGEVECEWELRKGSNDWTRTVLSKPEGGQ